LRISFFRGNLLPWSHGFHSQARVINPKQDLIGLLELDTDKEIIGEIFHARPANMEEMIQRRLEEWSFYGTFL
jgi:hypothetical protein